MLISPRKTENKKYFLSCTTAMIPTMVIIISFTQIVKPIDPLHGLFYMNSKNNHVPLPNCLCCDFEWILRIFNPDFQKRFEKENRFSSSAGVKIVLREVFKRM